jgi:hypothetical protein
VGGEADLSWGDYLWVTPDQRITHGRMMGSTMKKK